MPYFLERIDYVYKHHKAWTNQDFGDRLPSEVFSRAHPHLLHRRRRGHRGPLAPQPGPHPLGVRLPALRLHLAAAPEMAMRYLEGLPDEDIDKITHRNAMANFGYDPFAHIRASSARWAPCRPWPPTWSPRR
ncbi:MAG: hypothetical protein R2746_16540 [Acidimicrobiales bacterium]